MAELNVFRTLARERPRRVPFGTSTAEAGLPWLKPFQVAVIALKAGAQNAYCINWQNPEDVDIMVFHVIVHITVAGVATSDLDLGSAASASTHSDNLIDGAALDGAPPVWLNSYDDHGTNGVAIQYLNANGGATDWITGQIITAAGTNLAGTVYIIYTTMDWRT